MTQAEGRSAAEMPGPDSDDDPTGSAVAGGQNRGTIGPYRLLQKVGEGGMGEVWVADQTAPVRRKVALKLIKAGMDTKQVMARFEAERQALALMDHPAIAKVFDAGETPAGRPYFAMEYVQGVPLTAHCDRQRLTTEERLQLFMHVCEGVQHAHHKAIIHRDLKPSNVLVTMQDGKPTPKIIDFGVAKATAQRLTERTMFTELGVLIGTPEYMSPEQADLTAQDIDTRTDVYSLGAMLYQLLVGALPFDSRELRRGGFDEIRRRIREEEPPRPSTRLSTLGGEATTEFARRRRVDVKTLRRQLRGDLDWITMKALEKDRTRRYSSPADLAADIRRHLRHEPVLAGSPSATYRAGKFVRRHRFGVATAAVGLVALVGFAVAMAIQVRRTALERQRAEQVSKFLTSLFTSADPRVTAGREVSLREVLDRGAKRIDTELASEPEVQAQLLQTIGWVYLWVAKYDEAERLLTRAVELRRSLLGDDHPDTLTSRSALGGVYQRQGRHAESAKVYEEVLAARRRVLGEDHPDTLWSMNDVASGISLQGRYAEAEALYRETLEKRRRVSGEDHADTLWLMDNVAGIAAAQGRHAEAAGLLREVLVKRRRVSGDDHPDTLSTMSALADTLRRQGQFEEAEALRREALEKRRRVLGEDHPDTLSSMDDVALTLSAQGRHAEAEKLHREVLDKQRRVLGEDHPSTLASMNNVALTLSAQGRHAEAETLHREVLDKLRRGLGEDHPSTLASMNNVARALRLQGRPAEAEQLHREVLEKQRRGLGEDHPDTLASMNNVARALQAQGLHTEAATLHREVLEKRRRLLGEDHPDTLVSMNTLAVALYSQEDYEESERLYREVLEKRRRLLGEDHPATLESMANVGVMLAAQRRLAEAETMLLDVLAAQRRVLGEESPAVRGTMYNLACLAALRGARTEAIAWLRQAVERGFDDVKSTSEDADLKSLHGDPAFEALLARMR